MIGIYFVFYFSYFSPAMGGNIMGYYLGEVNGKISMGDNEIWRRPLLSLSPLGWFTHEKQNGGFSTIQSS
jgi:hypothetical protein